MKIEKFIKCTDLLSKKEIEKVILLTYFHSTQKNNESFSVKDAVRWFKDLNLATPNKYRLLSNIRSSKDFIKKGNNKSFNLHAKKRQKLDELYKPFFKSPIKISHSDSILPKSLYSNTRQYIECIASQVNSSYENNINDGCAVLMRRLIEILLILSFKRFGIESTIKHNDGNYKMLKKIIVKAKQSNVLDLSRNAKQCLNKFRELGNFSAHKLHYNCKQSYIKEEIPNFRVTVEELLYKSDLIDK